MKLIKTSFVVVAFSGLMLTACGNERSSESSSSSSTAGTPSSPAWVLTSAPSEWREIGEAKQNAQQGEQIVLRGRIGGRVKPMTEGSPAFVMMDASIPSCADKEDDHCSIPWDYCCETPETIAANIATVIVVDESGNPVSSELTSAGLEPLDEVIVVGTVDARPNQSVLTIRATGIHRKKG